MSYLIPLSKAPPEYGAPRTVIERDSETLVLEIPRHLIDSFEKGFLVIEPYRPNFRKRFRPEPSYQFSIALDASSSYWYKRRLVDSPHPRQGQTLHHTSLKKLSQMQTDSFVLVQIESAWKLWRVDPHVNPSAVKQQIEKTEKRVRLREAKEQKRLASKPSIFKQLLDRFLDD